MRRSRKRRLEKRKESMTAARAAKLKCIDMGHGILGVKGKQKRETLLLSPTKFKKSEEGRS